MSCTTLSVAWRKRNTTGSSSSGKWTSKYETQSWTWAGSIHAWTGLCWVGSGRTELLKIGVVWVVSRPPLFYMFNNFIDSLDCIHVSNVVGWIGFERQLFGFCWVKENPSTTDSGEIHCSSTIYLWIFIALGRRACMLHFYRASGQQCWRATRYWYSISVRLSAARLSVCHVPVLCLNGLKYRQTFFSVWYPNHSSFPQY